MPREFTLEDAQRDLQAHAKTISAYEGEFADLHRRLDALELANRNRELQDAREEERAKALDERLKRIEDAIKAIQGVGNKLVWIAVTGVAGAFLAFIIKGGLTP